MWLSDLKDRVVDTEWACVLGVRLLVATFLSPLNFSKTYGFRGVTPSGQMYRFFLN